MKELKKIMDTLYKTYGKAIPDVEDVGYVKRLQLSSPNLNYILGGGFPVGRIVEFYGPESGGKTVLASYIAGEFQKRESKNVVLFIDMEHAFEKNYARSVGMNLGKDKLIFVRPLNGEQAFEIAEKLVATGEIGCIVWDSIAATSTSASMDAGYGKSNFGGTAKLFSEGLRKLNPYLSVHETSLILLNQVRDDISSFSSIPGFKAETLPGGRGHKFYASWIGRVSRGEDIIEKKEIIGNVIKIKNVKSKIGIPKRSTTLNLYYDRGFDIDSEYIDFFIFLELVRVSGAWYSCDELNLKVQGKQNLLTWFLAHPDVFTAYKQKVNNLLYTTLPMDLVNLENSYPEEEEEDLDVSI